VDETLGRNGHWLDMKKEELSALAQRVHKEGEGRRLMAAAGAIEMIARERRAPGFEYARQAPASAEPPQP
jgi:hypothetical protein